MHQKTVATEKIRFTTRFSPAIQEKFQEAADLSGTTVNQFLVEAALEKANRLIERELTINLAREDSAMLFAMLEKPSPPNSVLAKASERYKKEVESGFLNTKARSIT